MAIRRNSTVREATTNTVEAMRRSAESRQCPECKRKSALCRYDDGMFSGSYCRWKDCDYKNIRETTPAPDATT